jgi:hypothetical protein
MSVARAVSRVPRPRSLPGFTADQIEDHIEIPGEFLETLGFVIGVPLISVSKVPVLSLGKYSNWGGFP